MEILPSKKGLPNLFYDFTKEKCDVYYKEKIILTGYKDPSTDLWTLPIDGTTSTSTAGKPQGVIKNPPPPLDHTINFAHSIRIKMNAVKFAHQSLCNPPISTLRKAVRAGYLDGCPNMSEALITKYLPPSTATAKGHMKRPPKGIRSTAKHIIQPIPNIHGF